jgi:hypothetical protein
VPARVFLAISIVTLQRGQDGRPFKQCSPAERLPYAPPANPELRKRSVVYTFAPTYVTVMLFGHEQATIVQAAVA